MTKGKNTISLCSVQQNAQPFFVKYVKALLRKNDFCLHAAFRKEACFYEKEKENFNIEFKAPRHTFHCSHVAASDPDRALADLLSRAARYRHGIPELQSLQPVKGKIYRV